MSVKYAIYIKAIYEQTETSNFIQKQKEIYAVRRRAGDSVLPELRQRKVQRREMHGTKTIRT